MKAVIDYKFDWRAMGWNAYVPIAIIIFVAVYSFLLIMTSVFWRLFMKCYFPFCSLVECFMFQDILEEEGSEVIFSYPVSRWRLGVVRVLMFLCLYLLLIVIESLYMFWISDSDWTVNLIQYSSQSFFYACLGFC